MTGERNEIYKLANDGFNLYTAASSDFVDGFEHSGYFAIIDKEGYIRSRVDQFGNPKNDGLGIPVIPSGPFVTSYQLIKIILIISPNPNVTIAR